MLNIIYYLGSYLEARHVAQENSEVSECDNMYDDLRTKRFKKTIFHKDEPISSPPALPSDGNLYVSNLILTIQTLVSFYVRLF